MSRSLSARLRMLRLAALFQPLPIAVAAACVSALLIAFNYEHVGPELSCWLNPRSDKFYSAAFTFMSTFWAASLSIWALIKSRVSRYIESLQYNLIFIRFCDQYERRLVYGFITLCTSFCIYVQDVKAPPNPDIVLYAMLVWAVAYLGSVAALLDVMFTARKIL